MRQTAQRMIERLHARALEFLELSERRLGIDHVPVVGQAGIVDLQNDSGIGNRFIFLAHRLGSGEDEFLFSRVMKVFAARETAWPDRAHEAFVGSGRRHRFLQVGDVVRDRGVADIFQRPGADRTPARAGAGGAAE